MGHKQLIPDQLTFHSLIIYFTFPFAISMRLYSFFHTFLFPIAPSLELTALPCSSFLGLPKFPFYRRTFKSAFLYSPKMIL